MPTPEPPPDPWALPGPLRPALERLGHITGFVTTLHAPGDPRPLAFGRRFHVRRVVATARWLARARTAAGRPVDQGRVAWLAWAHDLNRWPFAHNGERGFYDQAADLPRYFRDGGIAAAAADVAELQRVHARAVGGLSEEGRIVLLADTVTGFLEDPLLAITGLDLVPEFVPAEVAAALALPLDVPAYRAELLRLNLLLHEGRDVGGFVRGFDAVHREAVRRVLWRLGAGAEDPLPAPAFAGLRALVKEQFMLPRLYPYNNEKVARGSELRRRLIAPLVAVLGEDAPHVLTAVDEPGVLELARRRGLTEVGGLRWVPDLEFVSREEPRLSFRLRH